MDKMAGEAKASRRPSCNSAAMFFHGATYASAHWGLQSIQSLSAICSEDSWAVFSLTVFVAAWATVLWRAGITITAADMMTPTATATAIIVVLVILIAAFVAKAVLVPYWGREQPTEAKEGAGIREHYGPPPGVYRAITPEELGPRGWTDMPYEYEANTASSISHMIERSA
jgi:hypothetical protein